MTPSASPTSGFAPLPLSLRVDCLDSDGLVSGLPPGETNGHWVDHQIRLEPGPGDTITVRNCTLFGYGKAVGQGWSDGIDIFSPNGGIPPTILIADNTILGPLGGTEAASGVELNGGNAQTAPIQIDLRYRGGRIEHPTLGLHMSEVSSKPAGLRARAAAGKVPFTTNHTGDSTDPGCCRKGSSKICSQLNQVWRVAREYYDAL